MSTTSATKRFVFGDAGHCAACGFGLGLTPKMPGTAGSLLAFPLYFLTASAPFFAQVILLLAMTVGGIWLCGRAAKALAVKDDAGIVFDEIAGFYAVLVFLPEKWEWQAAGFLLFRVLDAAKPPPMGWLDRNVGGGLGIMLDDLAAAAVAVLVLRAAMLAAG